MSKKSASYPLLPIEPTILTRLNVNLELKYWHSNGQRIGSELLQNILYFRKRFDPYAVVSLSPGGSNICKVDTSRHTSYYMYHNDTVNNVKKYVGEFY